MRNRQVRLARRPHGAVREDDFSVVDAPMPAPGPDEVLIECLWLSLDPYQRMRMNDAPSYAPSVAVGEVMVGETVGRVIESRSPRLAPGDHVAGPTGWQCFAAMPARRLRTVDPGLAPLPAHLGVLGMPAVTAWVGLTHMAVPTAGETVVVSAASGAVGSVAGQIARLRGCRVIGIAGGATKCAHVVDDLGFDACLDYKLPGLARRVATAAPQGVHIYFDNVGGPVLDAVLATLAPFARIALCGQVSQYQTDVPYPLQNLRSLLVNRVRVQGFIVSDHMPLWPQALAELTGWFHAGQLSHRESVADGIDSAPRAFIAMLAGDKVGKQVVRLALQ